MNVVEQIRDALLLEVADELGAGWDALRFTLNPEQADFRNVKNSYGVRFGSAEPASTVTRTYTLDHSFEILLTDRVIKRQNDDEVLEAEERLYDKMDDIFRRLYNRKLGLPSIVLNVFDARMDAPEVLDNNAVLLIGSVTIKWRNDTGG
jgi:hypothetical protein